MNSLRSYVTPMPHVVTAQHTVRAASQWMDALGAQHVAVVSEGRVVGIVARRALALADDGQVGEVMDQALIAGPDSLLEKVAEEMAARGFEAAVVVEGLRVIGTFTARDALWAIAELCAESRQRRAS